MPVFRRRTSTAGQAAPPTLREDPPAPHGMRSMADHRDHLLAMVQPLEPVRMDLLEATGLVLCEEITARVSLPRFDNAQMDGFAVRAADVAGAGAGTPVGLQVAGVVNAGDDGRPAAGAGIAVRVMTGAPMPPGADSVVPFEACDPASRALGAATVVVLEPVAAGQNVRPLGSDTTEGDLLARPGQVLDARRVGLLAGAGVGTVLVRPRPRVVVVSTGAELVDPGEPLQRPAQIHDANGHLVAAAAREAGATVVRLPAHSDDPVVVRDVIAAHLDGTDLVVTTGGISQGDADVVKQVLPGMGAAEFTTVAMQPGKPQGFAFAGTAEAAVPVVTLPGNPVSSYVSFHAFVLPLLDRMMGREPVGHRSVRAVVQEPMASVRGKLQFARGLVEDDGGRPGVRLVGGHGSHLLGELARSNALVLLEPEVEQVAVGDVVECWLLGNG